MKKSFLLTHDFNLQEVLSISKSQMQRIQSEKRLDNFNNFFSPKSATLTP